MLVETHVLKHHNATQKESSRVGHALASNVRGRTVDGLENGGRRANVTGRGKTETTDQASAHVGKNVTVQVGHDKDLVVVRSGVGGDVQAAVVQQLSAELDVGEVLGNVTGKVEEKTIGHLLDGSLVDDADLLLVDRASVLEGVAQHTLGSLLGDKLDALHDTGHDNVLDTRVFTLRVLTDQDSVDIVVGGLVTRNGPAGTHVCEEVEGTTESKVHGDVTLANGGLTQFSTENSMGIREDRAYSKRTLKRNLVAVYALDGIVGDSLSSILEDGSDIHRLPLDRSLQPEF